MARASDPILARNAAIFVLKTLRAGGHEAYFAGGCVRDALLGSQPTDYDIATDATPERVRTLLPRTQHVGEIFGVVLAVVKATDLPNELRQDLFAPSEARATIEVATFRSDGPYHDARRPEHVTFSDAQSDAERRDFTINALFLDPLTSQGAPGTIIDFVGGLADLHAKIIRAVGDPDRRLAEDHLRALRAVRFTSRLGFALDPATAAAIRRHASELRGVSRERIGEELRRMLAHPASPRAIDLLTELGLDGLVLGQSPMPDTPRPLVAKVAGVTETPDAARAMLILAAWLTDRAGCWLDAAQTQNAVADARAAMCLSNDESDLLRETLFSTVNIGVFHELPTARQKRLAAKLSFPFALALRKAGDPSLGASVEMRVRELRADGIGVHPEPLVSGDDLISAGVQPSPRFKAALDAAYDAQLEGRVREKAAALELATRVCVQL